MRRRETQDRTRRIMMPAGSATPVVCNEKGRIEILPGEPVPALSWGTWTFRWTLGFDVVAGGGLEIILVPRFPTNRWSLPQTQDPTAPGFVTARAGDDVIVTAEVLRWPLLQKPHGATLHIIQMATGGRTMRKGEVIDVTYGDRRGGSLGTQAQAIAREVAFPVFVASGGAPRFLERFVGWQRATDITSLREQADFSPTLQVVGSEPHSFHLVAPMEVAPDEPFQIRLSVLDRTANRAAAYDGVVDIHATDPHGMTRSELSVDGSPVAIDNIRLKTKGFQRLYAVDPNRGILGVSNPIRVVEDPAPIYWGDLHGHSRASDGTGTADEHYAYARDVALLDFAAVSDHDHVLEPHPKRWDMACKKAREHTQPGRFVAILAYEGRLRDGDTGKGLCDINVYYASDQDDMLEPFPAPLTPSLLSGKDILLIPHTPLYGIFSIFRGNSDSHRFLMFL
jgi:hypothetical protein